MAEVVLQPEASADLAGIYAFSVVRFGREVAEEYLRGLNSAFDRLGDFPESGALDAKIKPPARCLVYRSHRIFYDFDGESVTVIRILHHAMNAGPRLRQ